MECNYFLDIFLDYKKNYWGSEKAFLYEYIYLEILSVFKLKTEK